MNEIYRYSYLLTTYYYGKKFYKKIEEKVVHSNAHIGH